MKSKGLLPEDERTNFSKLKFIDLKMVNIDKDVKSQDSGVYVCLTHYVKAVDALTWAEQEIERLKIKYEKI